MCNGICPPAQKSPNLLIALADQTQTMRYRNYRIVKPEEAIPLITSRKFKYVSIDTEFDGNYPPSKTTLTGLSVAVGNPVDGFTGTAWEINAETGLNVWNRIKDLLLKIFADPERVVVMHGAMIDMQVLRARGVGLDEGMKCKLFDTYSGIHTYDENLHKALKDLGASILGFQGLKDFSTMKKEQHVLERDKQNEVKQALRDCWDLYKIDYQQGQFDLFRGQASPKNDGNPLRTYMSGLPVGLTKNKFVDVMERRLFDTLGAKYNLKMSEDFLQYSALDAILTLMLAFFLLEEMPKDMWEHAKFEMRTAHPHTTEMAECGHKIDVKRLTDIRSALDYALASIQKELKETWNLQPEETASVKQTEDHQKEEFEDKEEFNFGSSDQVAKKIWVEWGLTPPPWVFRNKRDKVLDENFARKDGLPSTGKEVLQWLSHNAQEPYNGYIHNLLEYRQFMKIKTAFVDSMLELALRDPDHRVYPSFWHLGARSGRYAVKDPACNTIPRPSSMPAILVPAGADPKSPPPGMVLTERENKANGTKTLIWQVDSLRKAFIAPEGWVLIAVDLSQIENCWIAYESQDPTLLDIFRRYDCADCGNSGTLMETRHTCPHCGAKAGKRNKLDPKQPAIKGFCLGRDIHSATAAAVGFFDKYPAKVARNAAKVLNHAFNYGIGSFTLSRREDIERQEAQRLLDLLAQRYARVAKLGSRVEKEIREKGYVKLFDGSVRRFHAQQILLQAYALPDWRLEGTKREAVNVLAQGAVAKQVKRAQEEIRKKKLAHPNPKIRAMRQVSNIHDELLFEAPEEVAKEAMDLIIHAMETSVNIGIPIRAEGAYAKNWEDAKP